MKTFKVSTNVDLIKLRCTKCGTINTLSIYEGNAVDCVSVGTPFKCKKCSTTIATVVEED
jgi:hypothetical protein